MLEHQKHSLTVRVIVQIILLSPLLLIFTDNIVYRLLIFMYALWFMSAYIREKV